MFYFDWTYLILLPAILFTAYAQAQVKSAYSKYSNVRAFKGLTGYEVASRILRQNGITDVSIEKVGGTLSDHFDPRNKVLRLSEAVYNGTDVAAAGIAAHEVGHAIQHNQGYAPLVFRNLIVPVAGIGSKFSWILFFIGILVSNEFLLNFGILLFSAVVIFQAATLPVEFDASNRAMVQLTNAGLIIEDERSSVKKVLNAAALTYVAALLTSVLQLVRLLAIANRYRDRR